MDCLWYMKGRWGMQCCILGLLLAGCTAPSPEFPVMPPRPPSERIQSTIIPPTSTPFPPPSPAALPEGISLLMEGAEVTFETLPELPAGSEAPTVQVKASPSTPYREVEQVLERLHDLGYLIQFVTQETP